MTCYLIAWLGLMIIGILNGILRVKTYGRLMPELTAHQISCITAILFIGAAVVLLDHYLPFGSLQQAVLTGAIWFMLTIIFEFGFGHYIMKHPWKKLMHDYRIDKGRLWLIVLIWILAVPVIVYSWF